MPLPSRTIRRLALGVLGVAFVGGAIYLWRSGIVTPSTVRAWLDSLGRAAPAVFIVTFVLGSFVGLPGIAFVIGGALAFGPWLGFALGYVGGLCAVTIPFGMARRLRRTDAPPWRPRNRHAARAFALLETHPFRGVLLLRLLLWFNPPLSYALAFAPVPFRTYLAACALALTPVVAIAIVVTTWFS
ncbi:MAG: associated Golgi protein [Deltaproteobacteria bacterium]|nr:associated Golgi protein [Deltaproteobacteria bacterium]